MKIYFKIKYSTQFGENIFITGKGESLGNLDYKNAIPLNYIDSNTWETTIDVTESMLDYYYIIKNENGEVIKEEWSNRKLELPKNKSAIYITDEWLAPNLPEFNFNTKLFKHISPKIQKEKFEPSENDTHYFVIPFRVMNEDERLYILGSPQKLGNWDEKNAKLMHFDGKANYFFSTDLSSQDSVFEYKFLIKNTTTGNIRYFETGANRLAQPTKNDALMVYHNVAFCQPKEALWRGSGIAVPVFSLRSKEGLGVGEFYDLIAFGDWCKAAGFSLIQILPIHDTTANHNWWDSYPYSAISVYALNPIYIRLSALSYGLSDNEIKEIEDKTKTLNKKESVDYVAVTSFKMKFLRDYFKKHITAILEDKKFLNYFEENKDWLKSYAAFSVLRDENGTADFTQWTEFSTYKNAEIEKFFSSQHTYYNNVMFFVFVQWQLHEQLSYAVQQLHQKDLTLKGDLPIGIYRHSADAWSQPQLFHMNQQAGAPPDDFAVLGQNWGFPTYNWDKMREDGYAWWKSRFQFMSRYFDAFRIDHILGFFRIWQIPMSATQGILGRFEPALPITIQELQERGIYLATDRLYKPYLHYDLIQMYFGDKTPEIISSYFDKKNDVGEYQFKTEFDNQSKIQNALGDKHPHTAILLELAANVLFIKEESCEELKLHPRYGMANTHNFKWLSRDLQEKLQSLYLDYFYNRQEQFWKEKGMEKLPMLKKATDMLTCGEDLGMVPKVVPSVMRDLAILSLNVQRMPCDETLRFFHPKDAHYLSVVSPSSHDTSTLRQWWQENREDTQYFYNHMLGESGQTPQELSEELLEKIVDQHLYSPAMLSVIPLQEFLGMDKSLRNPDADSERINIPAVFPHYWKYRMHVNIQDLIKNKSFTQKLKQKHQNAGRG